MMQIFITIHRITFIGSIDPHSIYFVGITKGKM